MARPWKLGDDPTWLAHIFQIGWETTNWYFISFVLQKRHHLAWWVVFVFFWVPSCLELIPSDASLNHTCCFRLTFSKPAHLICKSNALRLLHPWQPTWQWKNNHVMWRCTSHKCWLSIPILVFGSVWTPQIEPPHHRSGRISGNHQQGLLFFGGKGR